MLANLNGVNPHMKVLGAAFVTLVRMNSGPLPGPLKRREVRELVERRRACPKAMAPACEEMSENCAHESSHSEKSQ